MSQVNGQIGQSSGSANTAANNKTCSASPASGGVKQWITAFADAAGMTAQFFSGLGADNLLFTPDTAESQMMASSPGVTNAVNTYLTTGQPNGLYSLAQSPVTQEALVGSYAYVSQDPASRVTDHNLNHLVLQPDGKYDLVEGGRTKAVSEEKGVWTIQPGNPPNVLLKNEVLPIEIKKDEVRLLVDLDVGIWWTKAK